MNTEPFSLPLATRKHQALLHDYLEQLTPTSELGIQHNLTLPQIKEWLDHPQTRADIALLHSLIQQRAADARPHILENAHNTLHRLSQVGPGSKQLPEEIRQGEACRKATSALLRAFQPPKARTPITPASQPTTPALKQTAEKSLAQTPTHEATTQHKLRQRQLQKCVQSPHTLDAANQPPELNAKIRANHAVPNRSDARSQTRILDRERERPRYRFSDPEPADLLRER